MGIIAGSWNALKRHAKPALVLFATFLIVTGVAYPLLVAGVAQLAFPHQANGSVINENGTAVGSELIGQPFSDPSYFWGRLSATPDYPYNASLSSGSNLGPNNPALMDAVQARENALRSADPNNNAPIPVDLVTSSGSGLDPHISVASAMYQMPRVARARNLSENYVTALIDKYTQDRQFSVLGEKTVNVLELNLALDSLETAGVSSGATPANQELTLLGLNTFEWILLVIFFAILILSIKPLGRAIYRVYNGEGKVLNRVSSFVRTRVVGGKESGEMDWKNYLFSLLLLNAIGIVFLTALLMTQAYLPLNPNHAPNMSFDLAFNSAVSFGTNTNWQNYAGEAQASFLSQMIGLAVQNFLSAATGLAVAIALIRGIARRTTTELGNFWDDMVKAVAILLPIAFIISLVLVSQGSVQTFDGSVAVHLLQPVTDSSGKLVTQQVIPLGPAASQIAIKMLGTNGGGFFNANSAHPFENPTALSNIIEILAMLVIPAAICYTFGRMVKDTRQGWALIVAMLIIFVVFLGVGLWAEKAGNPNLTRIGVDQSSNGIQPGGNMEGKEVRFGTASSVLFITSTTSTSCGAVNSMIDSYTPLGGLAPMFLMQFGEVVFGGVGAGLYSILVFALIACFVAGLMIGRTPEYLGKKIDPYDMKLLVVIILIPIITVLLGAGLAVMTSVGRASIFNPGPHGFSEVLYAFTSAVNNNGSAFGGLAGNTPFYNFALAIAMLVGRFAVIAPTLALAGSLASKKYVPPSAGTLPTHNLLFIVWLVGVIVIVGALSYLCALSLGPIVEHLMQAGLI